MKAILLKKQPYKRSKNGGFYIRTFWKGEDNKNYILDVYKDHPRSKRFLNYLDPQTVLGNLNTIKGKFINGNSDFIFIGIKKNNNETN